MSIRKRLVEVDHFGGAGDGPAKTRYRWVRKNGRPIKLIDAESADFTEQLTDAFKSNVRKARAENREIADPN